MSIMGIIYQQYIKTNREIIMLILLSIMYLESIVLARLSTNIDASKREVISVKYIKCTYK